VLPPQSQDGLPGDRAPDGIGEVARAHVLEQVAPGTCLHRGDDVGVGVIGREDEHLRRLREGANGPRGSHAVEDRHPQVHQDQVGSEHRDEGERLRAVLRLADDVEVRFLGQDRRHAGAHDGVVVDDEETDAHRGTSNRRCVPRPGALVRVSTPATSAARALSPSRP
jgi:hypothetical protein